MTSEIRQAAARYIDANRASSIAREEFITELWKAWRSKILSQTEIAAAMQCSSPFVSDVFKGKRKISAELAGRILRAGEVTP